MWKEYLLIVSILFLSAESSVHKQQSIVAKAYRAIAEAIHDIERNA